MVAIRSIFLGTLALGSTLATATKKSCMTDGQALQVIKNWQNLIGDYSSELADAALTPDFTDYSASAADLNNVCPQAPVKSPPLDKPLFTSRDQFKQGQSGQPPIKSKILKHWHDCTTVSMRWKMTNLGSREVFGLIAFDTVVAPKGNTYARRASVSYSEFDSSAWIQNLQEIGKCNSTAAA